MAAPQFTSPTPRPCRRRSCTPNCCTIPAFFPFVHCSVPCGHLVGVCLLSRFFFLPLSLAHAVGCSSNPYLTISCVNFSPLATDPTCQIFPVPVRRRAPFRGARTNNSPLVSIRVGRRSLFGNTRSSRLSGHSLSTSSLSLHTAFSSFSLATIVVL